MKTRRPLGCIVALSCLMANAADADTPSQAPAEGLVREAVAASLEEGPFGSERWHLEAAQSRVEEYLGRTSLYLRDGLAWVEDAEPSRIRAATYSAICRVSGVTSGAGRSRIGASLGTSTSRL